MAVPLDQLFWARATMLDTDWAKSAPRTLSAGSRSCLSFAHDNLSAWCFVLESDGE
jgi:hypothetical protein